MSRLRDHFFYGDRYWDSYVLSITRGAGGASGWQTSRAGGAAGRRYTMTTTVPAVLPPAVSS